MRYIFLLFPIGCSPHPSSLLTLNSTSQGFLIPRMTTAQKNAIPTPATGLMVYDTDLNQIQVFNGTWGSLGGGSVAGSNGQVQFNNNGAFGASTNFRYNTTTNSVEVNNPTADGNYRLNVNGHIRGDWFEGNTLKIYGQNTLLNTSSLVIQGAGLWRGTGNSFYVTSGNFSVGTTQVDVAKMNVRGSGTANGTDALLVEASDGTDLFEVENGGLISVGKNVGATTQSTATIRVISGDTNTGLALVPKGNGPFVLSSSGNARGNFAVDLQTSRVLAANVASGNNSFIAGGYDNRASGEYSFVTGGSNLVSGEGSAAFGVDTEASGAGSFVSGRGGHAYLYGQKTHSSSPFSTGRTGDNQSSLIILKKDTISGSSQVELFLDGQSRKATLSLQKTTNARVWNARIQCVAIVTAQGNGTVAAGLTHSETYDIVIKRTSAGTVIVGSNPIGVIRVSEMSTASFTVDADTTNNALRIRFTPPSGTGSTTTIRAAATAYLTELGY